MYGLHPIVALDLARERSRAIDAEVALRHLAAGAALGGSPSGGPRRVGGLRRAAASALRTLAAATDRIAGSADRAACRLEGGPA